MHHRPVLLLLALLASQLALAREEVTLGVVNWIGYGPIYCAAANGYYKHHGRDVRLVTFSDNSLMSGALEGGELTATTLTYDQVLVADARGWNIKVVMPLDYSVGGDAILAGAGVKRVSDLKGRKVAFQPVSPSDFLLGYALAQAGLTEKDIRPVNSTPEGVVGVMASGAVDAGVTYQPSVATILKLGGGRQYHILLSSRDARGMITDVLAFRASTIRDDPRLVEGLIRGTLDGLTFMRREPVKAAAIIARALGVPAGEVSAQLSNVENPGVAQLRDIFKKSDTLPSFYASGRVIGQVLVSEGLLKQLPAIDQTFDARFVDAIQANPGGSR